MPTDASEPYEETEPLREVLAAINRNGFVTTFSQPGEAIAKKGVGQRAAVEGWARGGHCPMSRVSRSVDGLASVRL